MRSNLVLSLVTTTALLSLSACASIIEGSTDNVSVVTTPPTNASCTLANSRGSYNAGSSGVATVKKSKSALDVVCTDLQSGARGQKTVESDVEAWAFGNILIGGLIGLGVDWGTGAAYDYPASATVPMSAPVAAAPTAAPFETLAPANGVAAAPNLVAPAPTSQAPSTVIYAPSTGQTYAPSAIPAQRYPVPSGY